MLSGVILYQSTSGDSSTGEARFEASDSTLKSYVTNGAMFYITNTDANIVLNNTSLDFDSDSNTLLTVGGNDGSNNWGTVGSNGGNVTFTAIRETLFGDISCDGISSVTFYLTEGSIYTGSIIQDTTYTGNGGVSMNLAAGTTWKVTEDTTLISLNQADNAVIQDTDGKTVTIKTKDGNTIVNGNSSITITTDSYTTEDNLSSAQTITDFTIDRSDFNSYFSAGSTDSTNNNVKTTKPSKTSITKLTSTKNSITLSWKKVSDSDGYIIYRSTKKNGNYKKIATVKKAKNNLQ